MFFTSSKIKIFSCIPIIFFILLIIFFFRALDSNKSTSEKRSNMIGKNLPSLKQLPSQLNDHKVLSSKIYLLNVWATWCPSCYEEHLFLNQLKLRGINIVGLNYKDKPEFANKFLGKLGNPFENVYFDQTGMYGLDIGVYGAPETYVIKEGRVVYKFVGVLNKNIWIDNFERYFS